MCVAPLCCTKSYSYKAGLRDALDLCPALMMLVPLLCFTRRDGRARTR
jgi:hypothetical protein